MPTIKLPKTVKVEDLRKFMGDKRVEDFLTLRYGPKMTAGQAPIRIERATIEHMLAILENREIEGQPLKLALVPPAFRLFYREVPFARIRLIKWLQDKLAAAEANNGHAPGMTLKTPSETRVASIKAAKFKRKHPVKGRKVHGH